MDLLGCFSFNFKKGKVTGSPWSHRSSPHCSLCLDPNCLCDSRDSSRTTVKSLRNRTEGSQECLAPHRPEVGRLSPITDWQDSHYQSTGNQSGSPPQTSCLLLCPWVIIPKLQPNFQYWLKVKKVPVGSLGFWLQEKNKQTENESPLP